MGPIPSFFKLPVITRYRLATAAGAVIMGLTTLGRLFFDTLAAEDVLFYSRLGCVIGMALFAGFAHLLPVVRRYPHGFIFIAWAPLITHITLVTYYADIEPGLLLAGVIGIGITAALMDSAAWLKTLLTTWCLSILAAIWSVVDPQTSQVTASIIIIATCIFSFFVTSGFAGSRQELDRLAAILEESQSFSGVGAWQKNLITNQVTWTKTTYDILEIPYDEAPDTEHTERLLVPDEDSDLHRATQHMLATGEPYDVVDQIVTQTGKHIWIHARGKVTLENGVPVRAMGVFTDITEQVEREQALTEAKEDAEAAATARAQFMANMSHEIRTPMNGVLGMASMLAQEELPVKARHLVEVIRTSGESLLNIINDILDFAKLEAGKLELERRPFSIETMVHNAVQMVRHAIDEKNINLNVYLPNKLGEAQQNYLGDDIRIQQVLLNLLSNAVKFTQKGDITVSAASKPRESGGHWLAISVSDTGVGVPQDKLESLFDAFTQADASTTREYGGTGLGLAICRELVEVMGGTIEAHSKEGLGSTFTFRVPIAMTDQPVVAVDIEAHHATAAAATAVESAAEEAPESALRILLAEDNPVNQKVAAMMLQKLGYATQVADNGREAVEAVQAATFDVVFMDLQMPELDGLAATRAIRANAEIEQPCIIALTANAMDEDKRRCFEAGMDYFLAKPMRMNDLKDAIDNVATG